jgi:hypothetical protein
VSADIAANEIYKLRNEIARLKGQTNWVCSCGGTDCKGQQENADLRGTLDAVIEADGRAADLWRAAHPGKELVIPDRAKLVGWLLEQNAALRADKERLDWLTDSLGWIVVGYPEADPSQHATEDNTIADAWRAAIDAARKEARP